MTDLLLDDEVSSAVERAAMGVWSRHRDLYEATDLVQEGMLLVLANPETYADALGKGGIAKLRQMVWCDLMNIAQKERRRHGRNVPLEAWHEGL